MKTIQSKLRIMAVAIALVGMCVIITPTSAMAQQSDNQRLRELMIERFHRMHEMRAKNPQGREPLVYFNGKYLGNNTQLMAQINLERSQSNNVPQGFGYMIDTEPVIREIKFFKPEEPKTLTQRIDALLHGVTVTLPHEYDVYGYEIRRYMSSIAGPEVLADPKRLAKELANAERAKIVFDHWQKKLLAQMNELEKIIEEDRNIEPTTRTTFRFKSGKVRAFITETNSWISNNHKMLEFLFERRNQYKYTHPKINFSTREDANRFLDIFRARQKSVELMHEYAPFRSMIY
ncbi:MAG: hypothetical protein AB8B83_07185 [Bdellovibrionales bacterium]